MANTLRCKRIQQEIQRGLAQLISTQAQDPRFHFITITAVDVSPDLSQARVYVFFEAEEEQEDTLKALNHAAGYFRHALAKKSNMRVTPRLHFHYDTVMERAEHLTDLLRSVKKEEQ